VSSIGLGGWDWTNENALALYGTYTALVYLTPILGGYLADNYLGYRRAVILGALIMTLGHASMAIEFAHVFLYIGIGLLIIGNGFFKPNMTSIISNMYQDRPEKKDGAYTIFYMGVNAGAFLGILLCGYLGEKVGWSYGFGLAGIFMFLGMLQFTFAHKLFGHIGDKPEKGAHDKAPEQNKKLEFEGDRFNPFTKIDKILIFVSAIIGVLYIINDPLSKIAGVNLLKFGSFDMSNILIGIGLLSFLVLIFWRIFRYPNIVRDRMVAIVIFAVFTIVFWMCFEQAGGSMTIFANSYTNRLMSGDYATIFLVVNIIITVVPVGIISWVLFQLFRKTIKKIALSNIILASSFVIIWGIIFWMINRDLNSASYVVQYKSIQTAKIDSKTGLQQKDKRTGELLFNTTAITESTKLKPSDNVVTSTTKIIEPIQLKVGEAVEIYDINKKGKFVYIDGDREKKIRAADEALGKPSLVVDAKVSKIMENEIEIPATWFLILNSLFIITFAPLFSKWWESKFNPSAAVKYGLGLILLGIGFGALAIGAFGIPSDAKTASVSLIWLVLAYLFHTLGELCLSPVALSYVSKLVPGRMIAMMFGVWYVAVAIGNKLAGMLGGEIDNIRSDYSMTAFFLIFTIVPMILGAIAIILHPILKRLMHGVK
ncbi:MAG TPA: peptide MFS transporter, partial [Arachidicoccus soli]|nr:peptide MFS transporter [Arachidicoccus soli]